MALRDEDGRTLRMGIRTRSKRAMLGRVRSPHCKVSVSALLLPHIPCSTAPLLSLLGMCARLYLGGDLCLCLCGCGYGYRYVCVSVCVCLCSVLSGQCNVSLHVSHTANKTLALLLATVLAAPLANVRFRRRNLQSSCCQRLAIPQGSALALVPPPKENNFKERRRRCRRRYDQDRSAFTIRESISWFW